MPSSITLRNGRDIPIAEAATEIRDKLLASADDDLLTLHLNDAGRDGAVAYVRAGEVALVIDTPTRPRL